jgi:hypothetical protein
LVQLFIGEYQLTLGARNPPRTSASGHSGLIPPGLPATWCPLWLESDPIAPAREWPTFSPTKVHEGNLLLS